MKLWAICDTKTGKLVSNVEVFEGEDWCVELDAMIPFTTRLFLFVGKPMVWCTAEEVHRFLDETEPTIDYYEPSSEDLTVIEIESVLRFDHHLSSFEYPVTFKQNTSVGRKMSK